MREGPPPLALRLLAPLLVASTLAVVGTGFALVVTGPARPGPFVALHVISFLVWMPATQSTCSPTSEQRPARTTSDN